MEVKDMQSLRSPYPTAREQLAKARPCEEIGGGYFVFRRNPTTGRISAGYAHPFEFPNLECSRIEAARLAERHPGEIVEVFVACHRVWVDPEPGKGAA